MTDDIRHVCAQELLITQVLPALNEALEVATEALRSDLQDTDTSIDRDTAKRLIYGYFASLAGKYPDRCHNADIAAIFWQFEPGNHAPANTSPDYSASDFEDDSDLVA